MSALSITTVNAIALYIMGKNPKMKTPQILYRINLAVADIMLGFFVFIPSIYFANERFEKVATVSSENISLINQAAMTTYKVGAFASFIGFVSWLSISVSMFTLVAASFDRVFATSFPARYVKREIVYVTIGMCVISWITPISTLIGWLVNPNCIFVSPFFVVSEGINSLIDSAVFSVIMLVLMLANSSIVFLVLYFHNRFIC